MFSFIPLIVKINLLSREGLMNKLTLLGFISLFFCFSAQAELSLNVKINQTIGEKTIEFIQNIKANFNQEIVINNNNLKDKIVLKLVKFKNISVNGNKINPIQVDLKLINDLQKTIGKPQTITSFYNREAHFSIPNKGEVVNLKLNFEEI